MAKAAAAIVAVFQGDKNRKRYINSTNPATLLRKGIIFKDPSTSGRRSPSFQSSGGSWRNCQSLWADHNGAPAPKKGKGLQGGQLLPLPPLFSHKSFNGRLACSAKREGIGGGQRDENNTTKREGKRGARRTKMSQKRGEILSADEG